MLITEIAERCNAHAGLFYYLFLISILINVFFLYKFGLAGATPLKIPRFLVTPKLKHLYPYCQSLAFASIWLIYLILIFAEMLMASRRKIVWIGPPPEAMRVSNTFYCVCS